MFLHTSNAAFDLTGYTGSAAISKSVAVGATLRNYYIISQLVLLVHLMEKCQFH